MKSTVSRRRITVPDIVDRKKECKRITALTAYDYPFASLLDKSDLDLVLVGDSLGTVIQGKSNTLTVTLEEMIYHCRCVSEAVEYALVVGDLPFLSYQSSIEKAVESAGLLLKEGGVAAVKLEGGVPMRSTIERLVDLDIPVMGHVGLTPQSYHRMGGHKLQGRSGRKGAGSRERVIEDALAVADAGAFALVIEGVPDEVAQEITERVSIPTIGIGAGVGCDGQILVLHDALGMIPDFSPRFVKRYCQLAEVINSAVDCYCAEVRSGEFPGSEHGVREGVNNGEE